MSDDDDARKPAGNPGGWNRVRLSVGLESTQAIIDDLGQAIDSAT